MNEIVRSMLLWVMGFTFGRMLFDILISIRNKKYKSVVVDVICIGICCLLGWITV